MDRQAAEEVADKGSWKYAPGLSLEEKGVDASVLAKFRARLIGHGLVQRVLDRIYNVLSMVSPSL